MSRRFDIAFAAYQARLEARNAPPPPPPLPAYDRLLIFATRWCWRLTCAGLLIVGWMILTLALIGVFST